MKLSGYLLKTTKETPKDADLKSHKLLLRGGYVKQVGAGIFTYLPIAWRALKKIENIIREEMDATGCQEINMPVAVPASLWAESGRYESVGDELLRFDDRSGRKMVLSMTHEEIVTDLIRYAVTSYKQLPMKVYQLQTKFRDEPRARGGLIRVREFVMKDAYSYHESYEDLEKYYQEMYDAYHKIFKRCGINALAVSSDTGMMGGSGADEFMAVTEAGEDTLVICSSCDYRANKEVAKAKRDYLKEEMLPMEDVATPNQKTIDEVATFLGTTADHTLKAVVYSTGEELAFCAIRGDLEINETKLRNYLKAKTIFLATDEELEAAGIVKGFASPVGQTFNGKKVRIIADESAANSSNLIAGGNKIDVHTKNTNFGRDWNTDEVLDISSVNEGEACPCCGKPLTVKRGIEIGNIFKLGTKYTQSMKCMYLNKEGKEVPMIMGCYGIGVGRLLASVLEVRADEDKILWPISIAPFEVELIGLHKDNQNNVKEICEDIYVKLKAAGIEVLYDDRNASPGFKFKDADLIGSPIKIALGEKSLQNGGAEVTIGNNEKTIVALDTLIDTVIKAKAELYAELNK